MSGKPLGYYGCRREHELIKDISESWGDSLQNISYCDRIFVIMSAARYLWENSHNSEFSDDAGEVVRRLGELPPNQIECLINALAD
jgi:hypothetical protein